MRSPETYAAKWLSGALEFAGLTGFKLQERLGGKNSGYVYRILRGEQQPSVAQMVKLLQACGLEVMELRVKKPGKPRQASGRPN